MNSCFANISMKKKALSLSPAAMADALDVLAWRNDAVTQKMSGSTGFINEVDHFEWFEKTIENPKKLMLIASDEHTNVKIGMVRFDLNHELTSSEISINIDPDYRGEGYGHQFLIRAAEYVSAVCPTCRVINAVVRVQNMASIRAFSSVGYREVARKSGLIHFRLDLK